MGTDDARRPGEPTQPGLTAMRAWAHPVRLRILSLLTGEALSAADVARALDLTHANASYHLRTLHRAGLLVVEGRQKVRGGAAVLYRYRPDLEGSEPPGAPTPAGTFRALADELVRRGEHARAGRQVIADADLWVPGEAWDAARTAVYEAVRALHEAAVAPGTAGAVRTSTTVAMFATGDAP
jgi:DNA-binding transcriptional ArsR family regulator